MSDLFSWDSENKIGLTSLTLLERCYTMSYCLLNSNRFTLTPFCAILRDYVRTLFHTLLYCQNFKRSESFNIMVTQYKSFTFNYLQNLNTRPYKSFICNKQPLFMNFQLSNFHCKEKPLKQNNQLYQLPTDGVSAHMQSLRHLQLHPPRSARFTLSFTEF